MCALPISPLQRIEPIPAIDAQARLAELIALAQHAQEVALPFMPRAGLDLVAADELDKGLRDAAAAWGGEHGEGSDAWVQLALRGGMPFSSDPTVTRTFARIAHQVFDGLPGVAIGHSSPATDAEQADG